MKTQPSAKPLAFMLFVIIALVAYWQVAFFYNTLKWDMLDCYIPWRGFVEDCISDKHFPYWCPYQFFGYPIQANMLSVGSPEYWISGIVQGSFSVYNLHFFFILFVIIAGYGMHRLTIYLGCNKTASIASGIVYMLCGYIVSQGQEMSSLAGMAWLPFTVLFYLRMTTKFIYADALKASVFMFLMISGAFPAITIILNYLFLCIFLVLLIRAVLDRNVVSIRKLIYYNFILYLLVVLMSAFFIISLKQSVHFVERFSGLSIENVVSIPFTPQSLISLIFPLATVKAPEFFQANLTMNNIYIGIFFLIFCAITIFRKRTLIENILIIFGIVALLAAFGPYTPVRSWLYHFPLMSMFKESSFFRPFVVLAMVVIAAKSLSDFFENPDRLKNKLFIFTYITGICIITAVAIAYFNLKEFSIPFINDNDHSDIFGHVFLQGLFQLGFIIAFVLLLKFWKYFNYSKIILVALIAVEMILSVQLNSYFTIVSPVSAKDLNIYVKNQPHGFPVPEQSPVKDNTHAAFSYFPLWQNTNTISRNISWEGFNSFKIKYRTWLFDNFRELHDKIITNPPLYISNEIYLFDSVKIKKSEYSAEALFLQKADYYSLLPIKKRTTTIEKINPVGFSPSHITAKVECSDSTIITYLQTYYTGWNFYLDGREQQLVRSNLNFMSGVVPAGQHLIEFRYSNTPVLSGFIITYSTFIIILLIILYLSLKKYLKTRVALFITLGILAVFSVVLIIFYSRQSNSDVSKSEYQNLRENLKSITKKTGLDATILLNCDRPDIIDSIKQTLPKSHVFYFRIENYKKLADFEAIIDSARQQNIVYFHNQVVNFPGIQEIIQEKYPVKIYERVFKSGKLVVFSKGENQNNNMQLSLIQDFNSSLPNWKISEYSRFDTTGRKRLLILDSISPYSPALTCKTSDLNIKKKIKKIVFKSDFIPSEKDNQIFIVLKYKKPLCEKREWYFPLDEYLKEENKNTHAVFALETDIPISRRNSLEVFLWNAGGKRVTVDKIELKFY